MSHPERPLYFDEPPMYVRTTLERGASPVPDPIDANYWWRHLPNKNTIRHEMPLGAVANLSPLETVQTAIRHLGILEEVGLPQPTTAYYLTDGSDPEKAKFYTASYAVEGLRFDILQFTRDDPTYINGWADSMQSYVDWVEQEGESHLLYDLWRSEQCLVGTIPVDDTERTYLIDTDPFLASMTPAQINNFRASIERQRPHNNPFLGQ